MRQLNGVLALRGIRGPARREGGGRAPRGEGNALADRGAPIPGARRRLRSPRADDRGPRMFVTHIECTVCGQRHEAGRLLTVCQVCGQMLAVRYDLPRVAAPVSKETLQSRPPGMYPFRELLPLAAGEEPVTPAAAGTPLLELPRLAAHLGLRHLWAK